MIPDMMADLFSCSMCGNTLSGMEWDGERDQTGEHDYKCPCCDHTFNKGELTGGEEDGKEI